ncbi:hypothetical protein BT96DRAFT_314310 [Gymnopus androsaceus JB14]|uniref:Uncharacterized protein n=1 Tax=Gymnopus androsaceus JB14 TaxID=1447944 RepID=A0A6A4I4L7_9AGAR|nr:hypothetical protein BT96DRAFT_314310 [Gymnopus androsaceus JB14]
MVCHSISRWLEDKSEVIPDQIYFKHIFPLYSQVLNKLIKEQPNQKTLNTLWMLFIAPLDGPESRAGGVFHYFEDFWLATYHKRPEFIPQYEPELKMVLKALGKVDERGFAAGLTQSDDSQGTVSVVPETQSLEPVPITGSQVIAQYCDAFAAAQLNNNNRTQIKSLEIVPSSSSPIREPLPVSSNTTPRRKMDNFLEIIPSSCSPIRESSSVASGRNLDASMAVDDQDLDRTSKSIGKKRKRHSKDLEIVEDSQPSSSSSSTRAQDVSQSRGGADPITGSQSYSMNLRCQQQVATPSSKGKAKAAQQPQQTPAKRRQKASGVGVSASLSWNQLMTPEPSITPSSHGRAAVLVPHLEEEEEDYDWEKEVVSPASFAQISRELDADAPADADVDMDPPDPNDGAVNSPSVRPVKKRKTSPVTTAALNSPTPSGRVTRSGTTSAKVLQLQRALQALNDDQTPMEDLAQASKLAQEFGSSVNEKIASRNQSKRRVRRS